MKNTIETTPQTVITYSSPRGGSINLTPKQVNILEAARVWPRDWSGEEYCTVSHGKHYGCPDTDSGLVSDLMAL